MALIKPNTNSYRHPIYYQTFLITTLLLLLPCICNANNVIYGFKGMFIFGSSVVDNGNNNNLITLAKANYPPYGIDFPLNSTGRFSNGKMFADFIGDYLGLPLLPTFAASQTTGASVVRGVNFASAASGILDETGAIAGMRIPLNQQIANFEQKTLPQLEEQVKRRREEILGNYLFLMAIANNDYLLNYFLLNATSSPQDFASRLTSAYVDQVKRLYKLGARKFLVLSVYPVGCSPAVSGGRGCLSDRNAVVKIFHDQLITAIDRLKPQLPASCFVIINSIKIITDIIQNPQPYGFSNVTGGCCELTETGVLCKRDGKVCQDRTSYVYFDGQHNTQALSAVIAQKTCTSIDSSEVYPYNLNVLRLLSIIPPF